MGKNNMRFLSSLLVMAIFGVGVADAAPSVRMLGTSAARVGNNATVVRANPNTDASSNNTQRLGTIRKVGTTATPVTVKKVANSTAAGANDADAARLSLGKYIHSTGVASGRITPVSTTPSAASQDFLSLVDRVNSLEGEVGNKQSMLIAGDGIDLTNNTVSVGENIAVLPNRMDDLADAVEEKISMSDLNTALTDYYTAGEIDDMIETAGGTVYSGGNGVVVGGGNNIGLDVTPVAGSVYVFTSDGWNELITEDTWE